MIDVDGDDEIIKFSQFYRYLDTLGSGGFGKVVKALNTNNEEVAVKVLYYSLLRSFQRRNFGVRRSLSSLMRPTYWLG